MAIKEKAERKTGKKHKHPDGHRKGLGVKVGKVGAAIAGVILAEMAQSALRHSTSPAADSLTEETQDNSGLRSAAASGNAASLGNDGTISEPFNSEPSSSEPSNSAKGSKKQGKTKKRLKLFGSNPGKIGAAIASAVLAEMAQKAFSPEPLAEQNGIKGPAETIAESAVDLIKATWGEVASQTEAEAEEAEAALGKSAAKAQTQEAAGNAQQAIIETGQTIAQTVGSVISEAASLPGALPTALAAVLPVDIASAAQAAGRADQLDSKNKLDSQDKQPKGKKKSKKNKHKKKGKK